MQGRAGFRSLADGIFDDFGDGAQELFLLGGGVGAVSQVNDDPGAICVSYFIVFLTALKLGRTNPKR